MTSTLKTWEKISGSFSPFQYAVDHGQITASLEAEGGPGWKAKIQGVLAVSLMLISG